MKNLIVALASLSLLAATPTARELIEKGHAALAKKDLAAARAEFEKALDLVPAGEKPALAKTIAQTLYQEAKSAKDGALKEAKLRVAKEILKRDDALAGKSAELRDLLSSVLLESGEIDDAAALDPQGDALVNLGIAYINRDSIKKAIEVLSKAVKQDPKSPMAYYYRGLAYLQDENLSGAKADLQKLLDLDPKNPLAREAAELLDGLEL